MTDAAAPVVPTQLSAARMAEGYALDIGANVGQWALANLPRYGNVVSVDANVDLVRGPLSLLQAQHAGRLEAVWALVTAEKDETPDNTFHVCVQHTTISTSSRAWRENSRFGDGQYQWRPVCGIPRMSVDTLVERYGPPALIKIDVEGYEGSVVRSMSRHHGQVALEWAEEAREDTVSALDHLVGLGYTQAFLQMGDEHTFLPQEGQWQDASAVRATLMGDTLLPERRTLWGMLHAR